MRAGHWENGSPVNTSFVYSCESCPIQRHNEIPDISCANLIVSP